MMIVLSDNKLFIKYKKDGWLKMANLNVTAISHKYNSKIIDIWNNHGSYIKENKGYHPLQRTNLQKSDLVFVGMNPSFNKKWVGSKIKKLGTSACGIKPDDLFTWDGSKSYTQDIIELDNAGEKSHAYHEALTRFAKSVDESLENTYTSLDLYAWRQTSQKEFINHVLPSNATFFEAQEDLFFEILKDIDPKVVVVANAAVCHFLKKKYPFVFDKKDGGYRLASSDGPVYIFSGMLSGGRALDIYSRERMSWHVRKVLGY